MATDGWTNDPAFQRAYSALSYFAGARDEARLMPFASVAPATHNLCAELGAPDRTTRAAALSRELAELARLLDERRLA